MSYFNATQQALAAGRHVFCPRFVDFDFVLERVRVWEGFGDIVMDGFTWRGFGELGSISDATFGKNDIAGSITYTLSGVSSKVISMAQAEASGVRGSPVTLYGRFFDVELITPLDSPFVLRSDIMDLLTYEGVGPTDRTVTLTCETIWTNRNAAAFAYFSDRDQQARFAGDLGMEFMSQMRNKRVVWPDVNAF